MFEDGNETITSASVHLSVSPSDSVQQIYVLNVI
jgi:hypothetical protein